MANDEMVIEMEAKKEEMEPPMVAVCGVSYRLKEVQILDNVSTVFERGELTAVMGPSGARSSAESATFF